ncbi:MAG: MFS transporter family glucose-6-phosphate receptor UhpC, partial [Chlamydiia bacterium]|nr:MFS transporter family glucose-6-phosphate receptor UhpC [Chlamydiia bacterium]
MSVLDVLKPEPPADEIRSEDEIKKKYRYWRIRVFYSMYIGYALFYFTRKSFTFAMPALITELGFEKSQLGILGTLL